MAASILRSTSTITTALICFLTFGACSDDDPPSTAPADAGTDRRTSGGSGGRGGSGGSGATGGSGGMDAGCTAVETSCDGAEDCPSGQRCCGRIEGMQPAFRYVEFACRASCAAGEGGVPEGGGMVTWLELCHAGETCENTMYQCQTSQYLPSSFARCFMPADAAAPDPGLSNAANAVNCGSVVCGAGEKCCLRQPLAPYCAPASETCACERTQPEGGGGSDGGPDADATTDAPADSPTTDSPDEGSTDSAPSG